MRLTSLVTIQISTTLPRNESVEGAAAAMGIFDVLRGLCRKEESVTEADLNGRLDASAALLSL